MKGMTRRAARSRDEYLAASKSRLKPWEAQGVSRRTWYRRQNAKAGTSAPPAACPSLPSQNAIPPAAPGLPPAEYAAARARVEVLLAGMAAENDKRRDWYAQPVEGWREGRLEIRGIDGETLTIELRNRHSRASAAISGVLRGNV
jgi:hypothetical protein